MRLMIMMTIMMMKVMMTMMTWHLFPSDRCQGGIEVVHVSIGGVDGRDVVIPLTVANLICIT